jgi:hypothetical protein
LDLRGRKKYAASYILSSASSYGPQCFYVDARTAKREIALFRCSNRVEVDSDNLYLLLLLLLLLLLCTRKSVGFSASEGGMPNFSLYDCVKI